MATPNDSPGTDQDEIQFEQAEFPAETSAVQEHVTRCNACAAAIPDVYFEARGKIVCAPCRDKIEAMFHQGSRLGRGIKAVLFGTIAAALGAILYYAIMRITGLNIGLVAVVVGLMVGGAVKAASGNRGGRFYQLLAVFLTYSAIVGMYVPEMLDVLQEGARPERPSPGGRRRWQAGAGAPLEQAKLEAGKKDHAPAAQPAVQPAQARQERPNLGRRAACPGRLDRICLRHPGPRRFSSADLGADLRLRALGGLEDQSQSPARLQRTVSPGHSPWRRTGDPARGGRR